MRSVADVADEEEGEEEQVMEMDETACSSSYGGWNMGSRTKCFERTLKTYSTMRYAQTGLLALLHI